LTLDSQVETGKVSANPSFADAAGGDFTPGANAQGVGYPGLYTGSDSTSYADIGAVQVQNTGGGGGGITRRIARLVGV
jgi:hypothetical protein